MSKYQVWTEGYSATGENAHATYHGEYEGETFKDAVISFRDALEQKRTRDLIDTENLTYWGCRFFDNGHDAAKGFG